MSISKTNILELQFSLRQAVVNCSERCQYQSAKWAAELLDALPDDDLGPEETSVTEVFDTQTDPAEARLERDELPKFLMAKALLDCHEPRPNFPGLYSGKLLKGLFLASYALLLVGEKEKTEEVGHILGPSDTGAVTNKQLAPLKRMLEIWFDQEPENRQSQGWLEYLLPRRAHPLLLYARLLPLCLDFLAHYSNILHTLNASSQLAFITHLDTSISRHRPETCIAIGNYYSLIHRPSSAIQSFRLALQLDRNFAAAWTLLGHEYYKLENSHAAIEAYRRAVEGDRKDYRAAVALRPNDAEVWEMVGACLMGMERVEQAIGALKRGVACCCSGAGNGPESEFQAKCRRVEMLFQLARAYEKVQERAEAVKCLESCLAESDRNEYLGNLDDPLRFKITYVLGQARLLLTQWTGADGDDTGARYLEDQAD
ncbi:Anaphase-promoting complex subunit 23 [Pseudogymnoascus australis]